MGLRPNRCYRKVERSYTRHAARVQKKDFIGGVPGVRTRQFVVGNQTKDYDWVIDVKAKENIQIRDNAIEAIRLKLVREFTKQIGKEGWVFKIRVYPFHMLRENKLASGAGADRVSSGMKHAFGKTIGRAVQIKSGDIFLSAVVNTPDLEKTKKILRKIKYKINMAYDLIVSKHTNKRLSGRKKWTRETKKAVVEEVAAPAATGKDATKPGAKDAKAPAGKAGTPAPAGKDAKAAPAGKTAAPAKDAGKGGKKK